MVPETTTPRNTAPVYHASREADDAHCLATPHGAGYLTLDDEGRRVLLQPCELTLCGDVALCETDEEAARLTALMDQARLDSCIPHLSPPRPAPTPLRTLPDYRCDACRDARRGACATCQADNARALAVLYPELAPAPAPAPLPEAACSTNAYVEIAGVRHQITARGNTPAEMARNYQDAVRALRASYEAEQAAARTARLDHLAACWLTKAVAQKDLPLAQRIVKAVALVQSAAVGAEYGGACTVRSQAGDLTYTVDRALSRCTCQDQQQRIARGESGLCKHLLAAELTARLDG